MHTSPRISSVAIAANMSEKVKKVLKTLGGPS